MTYVTTTITTIKNKPSSLVAKAVEGIMQEPRVFTDGDEQSWKFGQNNLLKSNNKKQRMKLRHQISNKKCQLPAHSLFSVINIGFSALHAVNYYVLSHDSTTRAEQHTTNRRSFYSLPRVVTLFCHLFLSNNTTYNVVQQYETHSPPRFFARSIPIPLCCCHQPDVLC